MDINQLFSFTCDQCNATFTKKCSLQRHISHMHDQYKFTCDICYSQFSRLYSLNNHKKGGKCKLDIGKNPIVSVTPLGNISLPQIDGTTRVSGWLEDTSTPLPTSTTGVDTRESTPSTSSGKRSALPSTTLPRKKTARAQIRAMASTAVNPKADVWNRRINFNPSLPADHLQQKVTSVDRQMPGDTLLRPVSLPQPALDNQTPTTLVDLDIPHKSDSRTTLLANPLSQVSSLTNLSELAEAINLAIEGGEGVTPTSEPKSGPHLWDLNDDLYLSDSTSASSDHIPPPLDVGLASGSCSDSNLSQVTTTLQVTPSTLEASPGGIHPPQTLHQSIMLLGNDLQDLVSLNKKVTPSNQLDVLWGIHTQLNNLMAPYRLYHG